MSRAGLILGLLACSRATPTVAEPPLASAEVALRSVEQVSEEPSDAAQDVTPSWCARDPDPGWLSPPWSPASAADLVPEILGWSDDCTAVRLDLDADGDVDVAVLGVDRQRRMARLFFLLAREGGFESRVAHEYAPLPSEADRFVYTALQLKPGGVSPRREYPFEGEAAFDVQREAVEVCAPARADARGVPTPMSSSNVCYCSDFYYLREGEIRRWTVCD